MLRRVTHQQRWERAKADTEIKAKKEFWGTILVCAITFGFRRWQGRPVMEDLIPIIIAAVVALVLIPAGEFFWNYLHASGRILWSRIAELEGIIEDRNREIATYKSASMKSSGLPNPRPEVMPVRFGETPDRHRGLFVKNDGAVTALSLYIPNVRFKDSILAFMGEPERLSKDDGEKLCEAWVINSNDTASAVRESIIKSGVGSVDIVMRYKDAENRWYKTTCNVEPSVQGIRTEFIKQEVVAPNIPILDVRVNTDYQNGMVCLEVKNNGAGAEFCAPITIKGAIRHEPPGDFFAKWMHTDRARTHIARGQTCRLLLAKLKRDYPTMQWMLFGVTDAGAWEFEAMYSSVMGNADSQAPDVGIRVDLISDPESDSGMQSYFVTLHSGRAVESVAMPQ